MRIVLSEQHQKLKWPGLVPAISNLTHAVSYRIEAVLFQQIGIPAVVSGPGYIEQAHKPDEWIEVSELRKCEGFK